MKQVQQIGVEFLIWVQSGNCNHNMFKIALIGMRLNHRALLSAALCRFAFHSFTPGLLRLDWWLSSVSEKRNSGGESWCEWRALGWRQQVQGDIRSLLIMPDSRLSITGSGEWAYGKWCHYPQYSWWCLSLPLSQLVLCCWAPFLLGSRDAVFVPFGCALFPSVAWLLICTREGKWAMVVWQSAWLTGYFFKVSKGPNSTIVPLLISVRTNHSWCPHNV